MACSYVMCTLECPVDLTCQMAEEQELTVEYYYSCKCTRALSCSLPLVPNKPPSSTTETTKEYYLVNESAQNVKRAEQRVFQNQEIRSSIWKRQ